VTRRRACSFGERLGGGGRNITSEFFRRHRHEVANIYAFGEMARRPAEWLPESIPFVGIDMGLAEDAS